MKKKNADRCRPAFFVVCPNRFRERASKPNLLQLDRRALLFQFLLQLLGVFLAEAFLDHLGGGLDQVLGFLQAQASRRADDLDDLNLLLATGLEDDVEGALGWLGLNSRGTAAATTGRHHHTAGGGFDAEFL